MSLCLCVFVSFFRHCLNFCSNRYYFPVFKLNGGIRLTQVEPYLVVYVCNRSPRIFRPFTGSLVQC
uniref:Uncharacterized protein n=1 Tax=Kuenenia stuttgartiensis TaxID=174633 RepID=Q1Q4H5_KUEST|nr:unknown protein [Candidatus Kuenenia stuttgartiensis]